MSSISVEVSIVAHDKDLDPNSLNSWFISQPYKCHEYSESFLSEYFNRGRNFHVLDLDVSDLDMLSASVCDEFNKILSYYSEFRYRELNPDSLIYNDDGFEIINGIVFNNDTKKSIFSSAHDDIKLSEAFFELNGADDGLLFKTSNKVDLLIRDMINGNVEEVLETEFNVDRFNNYYYAVLVSVSNNYNHKSIISNTVKSNESFDIVDNVYDIVKPLKKRRKR